MSPAQPTNPAETYEQYFVPAMFRPWADVLLRHACLQAGNRLLEVACGTGVVARQAASLVGVGGSVVATDTNTAMLGVARSLPAPRGPKIDWGEANAMALPFKDGGFDAVLCQHGLQFFPDRALALREMHRVLVPAGQATSIVLQSLGRHPVFEALMESVARQLAMPLSAVMTPFALSDTEELGTLFTLAGFRNVKIVSDSITARFPQPARFVVLAVMSSAAAVPAFARLEAPERASLLDKVREETAPVVQRYREADAIVFPMYANVAVAHK